MERRERQKQSGQFILCLEQLTNTGLKTKATVYPQNPACSNHTSHIQTLVYQFVQLFLGRDVNLRFAALN